MNINKFMQLTKERKIVYIVCFFLLFFSSCNFFYSDTRSTIVQGIEFWNTLFSGQIFDYYNLAGSVYGMIMNFIMGIWQIPLYILDSIMDKPILDFFLARIYGKMILIILVFGCGIVMRKIADEMKMKEENISICIMMFCSSAFIFSSICIVGQVDIYGVFFSLLAILYLMKGKRVGFLIFYVIAVQCKFFPFFIFAPIILLLEKKVIKVIIDICLPFLVYFLTDIPFRLSMDNKVTNDALISLTNCKVHLMGFGIPLSLLIFCAICIIAYLMKSPTEEKPKWIFFWGFAGIASMLLLYKECPYRIVYILPFTTLFFCNNLINPGFSTSHDEVGI